MNKYNFNKVIDRRGTGALKLEVLQERFGRPDLLPLWVADMDFATPPFIIEALRKRMEHPLFGYTVEPEEYRPAIIEWISSHHGWNVKREWLAYIPGVMKGIGMAINVFVKEDEKVIIQPPVYYPFRLVPQGNGRKVVYNPLHKNMDGSYSMDFDNLEAVTDKKCRMLVLSNPHNPAGITWDKKTLEHLASFCHRHRILVLSDEIHCDMALWGNKHIPFATVSQEAAACSITFGSPSKTFNMAGFNSSYAIIPEKEIRHRFFSWLTANGLNDPPLFAPITTIAAFRHGETWRRAMLSYVEDNIKFLMDYFARHLPQIVPLRPQASFLVWLDCRALNLTHDQLLRLFTEGASLALNDGLTFGKEGEGFMRINVAVARVVLRQALKQLNAAVNRQTNIRK